MRQPFGLILAGGRGSRMGGADKALLPFAGGTLLSRAFERFAPQVDRLAISANGDPARFPPGLPVLADALPDRPGPLAGILAGLDWAAGQGAESLVTVPVDAPFLPRDLVPRLLLPGGVLALAATEAGLQPTFGLWPVALRETLRRALAGGTRRVTEFTAAQGALAVPFPLARPDPFLNVNTPADLARAQGLA
jgi:molybdopterin-guanine dinucleotide biosynthesis protein A